MTDLEESVPLIRGTYPALITLAKLWHPSLPKRVVLLDKMVREGVIYAMLFSGDKLKLVHVELESLDLLIKEMGIYFVKHLKVISPWRRLTVARHTNNLIDPCQSTWK